MRPVRTTTDYANQAPSSRDPGNPEKAAKPGYRYRKVSTAFWLDRRIRQCGDKAKLLALYLMTGPHTTSLPGLWHAGRAQIAEALGWDTETLEEVLETLPEGFVTWDREACVVCLPNAIRYNPPENPNVVKGWRVNYDTVPESDLKGRWIRIANQYVSGLAKPFQVAFAEAFGNRSGTVTQTLSKTGAGSGTGAENRKIQIARARASLSVLSRVTRGVSALIGRDNPGGVLREAFAILRDAGFACRREGGTLLAELDGDVVAIDLHTVADIGEVDAYRVVLLPGVVGVTYDADEHQADVAIGLAASPLGTQPANAGPGVGSGEAFGGPNAGEPYPEEPTPSTVPSRHVQPPPPKESATRRASPAPKPAKAAPPDQPATFGGEPSPAPKAPKDTAHARYARAYAAGVERASGHTFPPPRQCKADLVEMAAYYAKDKATGTVLRGDALLAWFEATGAAYWTATHTAAQYQSGFSPGKCLAWLRSGAGEATRGGYTPRGNSGNIEHDDVKFGTSDEERERLDRERVEREMATEVWPGITRAEWLRREAAGEVVFKPGTELLDGTLVTGF